MASPGCKIVTPLMSLNYAEAHQRVLGLYRSFYRYIPYLMKYHDIEKTEEDCRWKLREKFYKNAYVRDIRVIDLLVLKGYMELKEQTEHWQMKHHIMQHWQPTVVPPPCGFIGKFLDGPD